MKFVAVTSCPTGIAHTYMAAEALEQAAADSGDEMHVETQGSAGSDPLDPQIIADADAVIFAADVEVRDRGALRGQAARPVRREAGHRRRGADARRGPRRGRGRPARGRRCSGAAAAAGGGGLATKVDSGAGFGTRLRQWLMTGVSYVIPFVAAGGLLIALGFALGGYQITDAPKVTEGFDPGSLQSWARAAVRDRRGRRSASWCRSWPASSPSRWPTGPRWCPASSAASSPARSGAGFLGGLVAGLLAGAVVLGDSQGQGAALGRRASCRWW